MPSKHSPAPWRVGRRILLAEYGQPGSKFGATTIEADGGCVQMLAFVTHDNLYPDETAANVRLIVAAPELLESCEQLVELLERCQPVVLGESDEAHAMRMIRAAARAVIAKATAIPSGGQSHDLGARP